MFNQENTEGFSDEELESINVAFDIECQLANTKKGEDKWDELFMYHLESIVGKGNI